MMMFPKAAPIRSKKLRDAARGEECTVQIPGVCNFNPETTVLAHLSFAGSGMGTKPTDVSACFACSDCHDVIDGRVETNWSAYSIGQMEGRAMARTWQRWHEMGLITIAGAK